MIHYIISPLRKAKIQDKLNKRNNINKSNRAETKETEEEPQKIKLSETSSTNMGETFVDKMKKFNSACCQ